MSPEELNDINTLLKNCRELSAEIDAMKKGEEFLLKEYKTNKRYFRNEPGRVTIEDVIKTAYEFGWTSHRQFQYDQEIENKK